MSHPYRDHAHDYLRAGWRGVLPLPAKRKGEPPTGYTGWSGIDPSPADVQAWTEDQPAGNIGLRLPLGAVGIDVDAYDGKPGDQTHARLEAELGPLPLTWVSSSKPMPSGIRVFRLPDTEPQKMANPGPGIEVIHYGWRYMVAAPSIHPSGAPYRWLDQTTGTITDTPPRLADLPVLPPAWVEHLRRGAPTDKAEADDPAVLAWLRQLRTGDACADKVADVLTEHQAAMTDGSARHDATVRASMRLVGLGANGHAGINAALTTIRDRFVPAVTTRTRDGSAEWQRMLRGAVQLVIREHPEPDTACYCTPTLDELPTPTDELEDRYPDLDWHALWDAGLDEPEWLVDQLVMTRRAGAIFARGKTGKSLIMLELAACIATGTPFAGLPVKRSHVVYVDKENDPGDVIDRLKTMGFHPDQLAGWLHYKSFPSLPDLDQSDGGQELVNLARRHDAAIVIIDTLARTVGGKENDADTYRDYAKRTGVALKEAGIAAIRLDHSGKDAQKGQRGSQAKNDDVDVVWHLNGTGGDVQRWRLEVFENIKRYRHGLDTVHLYRADDGRLRQPDRATLVELPTMDDKIAEVVDAMDELDLPVDWGRKRLGQALREAGHHAGNELIQAAKHARRMRSEVSGEGVRAGHAPDTRPDTLSPDTQSAVSGVPDTERTPTDTGHQRASEGVAGHHPGPQGPGGPDTSRAPAQDHLSQLLADELDAELIEERSA